MVDAPDERDVLAASILDRILGHYAEEQGGHLPVAVDSDVILQSLVVALA